MPRLRYVGWMIVLVACGGPDAGPLSSSEAEDLCRRGCEREAVCDSEPDPIDLCVADCAEDARLFRGDVLADLVDCLEDLSCEADETPCLVCEPTALHRRYEERCREQLAGCVDAGETLAVCEVDFIGFEDAGFVCIVNTDIIDDLMSCLDEPDCTTRLACMQSVFERFSN